MIVTALFLFAALAPPSAPKRDPLLEQGYRDMYNLQFDAAHKVFHRFQQQYPKDPMGPASDAAAYLFFAFDRLKILRSDFFTDDGNFTAKEQLKLDPHVKQEFEADLNLSKQLAGSILQKSPNDTNALLAMVTSIALHADFAALIEKRNMQALQEIKEARHQADKLLAICPECYDADLAIGVENYLLSQKSAPIRWFLKLTGAQADKETGIQRLRVVAEKGHYFKAYAKVLLAIANLRDGKKEGARQLIADLAREFPQNDLFRDELKKLS
ncbi:MAG TPA: hypothetical protein VH369_25305 [Bryobacteraceae bacterium]